MLLIILVIALESKIFACWVWVSWFIWEGVFCTVYGVGDLDLSASIIYSKCQNLGV